MINKIFKLKFCSIFLNKIDIFNFVTYNEKDQYLEQ